MDSLQPLRVVAIGDPKSGKTRCGVAYLTPEEMEEFRTFTIIDPETQKPRIFEKPTKSGKIKKIPMVIRGTHRVIYIGTEWGLDELKPTPKQSEETRWIDPTIIHTIEILDDSDDGLVKDTGFAMIGKKVDHNVAMDRVESVLQDIKRDIRIEQFNEVASMFAHKKHGIIPLRTFIAKMKRKKKESLTEDDMYDEILFEQWIKDGSDKITALHKTLDNFEKMFLIALYRKIRGIVVFDNISSYWDWLQDHRAVDLMGLEVNQLRRLVPTHEALQKEKGQQTSDREGKYNWDGMSAWNKVSGTHATQTLLLKSLPVDLWLVMQYAGSKDDKTGRMKIKGHKGTQYELGMVIHFDKVLPDPYSAFPNGTVKAEVTDMRTNVNAPESEDGRVLLDRDISFANLIRMKTGQELQRQFSVEPEMGLGISEDELANLDVDDDTGIEGGTGLPTMED